MPVDYLDSIDIYNRYVIRLNAHDIAIGAVSSIDCPIKPPTATLIKQPEAGKGSREGTQMARCFRDAKWRRT